MTSSAVEQFFEDYVVPPTGFIYRDIKREIEHARYGNAGGDVLAALGLLSYTEFMGSVSLQGDGSYTKQFKAFLRRMGENYAHLVDSREMDVYRLFRGGMVPSVFAKDLEIKMLNESGYPSGILVKPDGKYLFVVEKYFEDFVTACLGLYQEMLSFQEVYLPST
jgi:hypothetical protein